jgi:O-antigen/teichoic acid export membrane protein
MRNRVSVQAHEFLYFGKNTYFVQLYRSLHLNLDFLILGFIVSPKSFTEYSLAVTLAMTPQIYLASKQVSAQTLARDTRSLDSIVLNVRSTIKKNIFVSISFLLIEVVLFVLFHEYVFEESINNILLLLIILAPAYLIDVSSAYIGNLLIGLGQSVDYSALQLRGFVLNLIFLTIGIIFCGMIGAAIASLLSYSYVFYVSMQLLDAIKLKK